MELRRMTTRLEEAWYVDPELWAEKKEDQHSLESVDDELDASEKTVALHDSDLEETLEELRNSLDARHYKQVSLRGAVLVNDDDTATNDYEIEYGLLKGRALLSRMGYSVRNAAFRIENLKRSPIKIAAISFVFGVVTTFLGVMLVI